AAGLFGTYRGGEARLSTFTSSLDSDAFGIGGYFTSVIAGDLTGSLQFEYNRGHHDIVIGGATGNFSTDDIAVQGEIKGRYQIPNRATRPIDFLNLAWYEPMAALSFTHVSRESYTTNTGVTVASGNLDRARLTVGPRVGTTVLGDGENVNLIEPYFNLQGIWDFVNEGNFLVAAGTVVKTPDIGGLVGGGIEVSFMNNAAIKIESNYAFFEDDFDSWSISGIASMPLAALGILEEGSAGLVSLQFNALPASSSAMLQVNLPFN
ncbi:MAG: autotransporter outer membrane beta-barrel domain-containing protein, partial [Rhizobiales bacterium]|nr:autotransporter outer membrane beta-barrel domain-containing protein [Hyphomicrobiales bacterium]